MAFVRLNALCNDEGSDRDRETGSRPLSDSKSLSDDDTSLASFPYLRSETGVGCLGLTAICHDERGDCDDEVGSRLLSDSEFSSSDDDDASRVWFPYSRSETDVVFSRLTALCGDDGGDRKANSACNCALA